MSRMGRVRAETSAGWRSFIRRRTAVFFTFFFPVILIVIFGALVRTDPTGGGLFSRPPGYYVAGHLAVAPALVPFVALGVTLFCGVGALLGRLADSQDGVIAASNTIALPMLFLSDTFISLDQLPGWFGPLVELSPLTYFARGVRTITYGPAAGEPFVGNLLVLA